MRAKAGDVGLSRRLRLGRRHAGAAGRRCVVPALLPARRRRPTRGPDGCAAAAGGCRPLRRRLAMLRGLGFSAPEVFAEDRARGFLLIEDFGDDTYTRLLDRGADETGPLCPGGRHAGRAAARSRGAREPGLAPLRRGAAARRGGAAGRLVCAGGSRRAAVPTPARRISRAVASASAASGASRRHLGIARLSCRQSDAAAGSLRGAGLRAPRFSGRGVRPGELRSRIAPRRRAARCPGRRCAGR